MPERDPSIPEETVALGFHYLPPERLAEVDRVLRVLREDPRFEFLLAVFEVTINERRLNPAAEPSRGLLKKLLQALDQEDGTMMLYASPYNELGGAQVSDLGPRIEWWDLDLADSLCRFSDLRSVRAFLEHGTGSLALRSPEAAQSLHDALLRGLVGPSANFAVWGCTDIRTPGARSTASGCAPGEGLWPAEDVSPWFQGVFWDDLLFVLNPEESTLAVLAITSS